MQSVPITTYVVSSNPCRDPGELYLIQYLLYDKVCQWLISVLGFPLPVASEFWSGESGFPNLSCPWASKFQLVDWRVHFKWFQTFSFALLYKWRIILLFKIMFSYEIVISTPRGSFSSGKGNMCCQCQRNVCSVLVLSSSNDRALPLSLL
jgi:hypothetical protein